VRRRGVQSRIAQAPYRPVPAISVGQLLRDQFGSVRHCTRRWPRTMLRPLWTIRKTCWFDFIKGRGPYLPKGCYWCITRRDQLPVCCRRRDLIPFQGPLPGGGGAPSLDRTLSPTRCVFLEFRNGYGMVLMFRNPSPITRPCQGKNSLRKSADRSLRRSTSIPMQPRLPERLAT
jgi:hypothetical protein